MKIEEVTCEQLGPATPRDDGHQRAGDGDAYRGQRAAADQTHRVDVTEHKKAAAKTVKVSLLSDGSPKSVLKNTKNCCVANDVGPDGGDREIEIQTPITEIMERQKDEDVDKCVTRSAAAPGETRPASKSSAPVRTPEERVRRDHNESETVSSQQVTRATRHEEPGVPVVRNTDVLPHVDRPHDSDVHEEGGHDNDDGGENDDDDGGDHNDDNEEDDDSLVLSDDTCLTDGESHYITTHEIQLAELSDQEEDGQGRDVRPEEDSQVYAFVDYASFVDDVGATGSGGGADHDTRRPQSDLLGSDGSLSKTQNCVGSAPGGQVHLSIKTTSRAINDPGSDSQEKQNKNHHHHIACTRPGATGGRGYVFRGADGKTETLRDGAKCFIAAPGRLHFGRALKGRDAHGFSSSGASSALSELDDADKEVRNLTGHAFKSLAYPYLGAINFSSSSESSAASDHGVGMNRWSAYVDLKYGKLGVDQLVARQDPTSSCGISQNMAHMTNNTTGYKGVIKASANKLFTLNNDNSSTQKIELLGKFGRAHGGVFTLTETLNFRCNVESRMSEGERRAKFAQSATGSRSTDEVTDALPGRQRRAGSSRAPVNAGAAMDDTHKKAIFASSLLKNVISKKMQFEEERKMERGEICERQRSSSAAALAQLESNTRKDRALQRQSSRFSEASSDNTIVCLEDLGDMVDTGSCETISDCPRPEDPVTPTPEAPLESTNEAGMDPSKRGAFEAAKSTLLRSQNSAFRSWTDGELEFQTEHKNHKAPEESWDRTRTGREPDVSGPCSDPDNKLKKMSHLFVPTIQITPNEWEAEKLRPTMNYSMRASAVEGERGGVDLLSDTRYDADPRRLKTSKSPEIKINLRVKDNKREQLFGAASLRPHNAHGLPPADDSRCHALAAALKGECSDKVPHFMVRDIRDNKGRLQTPIHQVRDVRKLVKSSYHFVSLDNNDTKSNLLTTGGDSHADQKRQGPSRNQASVSPIVIKCQSVNTNSNGKQSGNLIDSFKSGARGEPQSEADRADRLSPEGARGGSSLFPNRPEPPNRADASEGSLGGHDHADKMADSGGGNQSAFRKLQAAVKTMEQLYVFDRNEWKRKSAPRRLADGHALSLSAAGEEEPDCGRSAPTTDPVAGRGVRPRGPPAFPDPPGAPDGAVPPRGEGRDPPRGEERDPPRGEERDPPRAPQRPAAHQDRLGFRPILAPGKTAYDFSAFPKRTAENRGGARAGAPDPLPPPRSPVLPVSVRISQAEAREKQRARSDLQNYLTIPLRAQAHAGKRVNSVPPSASQERSVYAGAGPAPPRPRPAAPPAPPAPRAPEKGAGRSPEQAPPPALYSPFPLGMVQPQVFCFSPAAMSPAPAAPEPFQATQRKMLLDPSTGSFYLVDTPVRPATRRLFDPETGQYVDLPLPQPPVAPVSVPPLALSPPGAYGQAYVLYPGFVPGLVPARGLSQQPQVLCVSQEGALAGDGGPYGDGPYAPYYLATGRSPQQQQQGAGPPPGGKPPPLISFLSQPGTPRIVAPPSFDGTTMSFVVEHR